MSNQNMAVQHRQFVVKAGMTAEDVKNSKEATALQKKYANAFDSDGQKGFSQKEADLFNATTFSEKADGSVTFWTRQKDGTKKGIKFTGNIDEMNYSTKSEVQPYVTTKKVIKHVQHNKKVASQEENVSFFDSKWSGAQIAKLTGDNAITDWLQDKDKVCTDGKDDGKIGFWEGIKSFGKGLIGGIPKMIINHPLATAVTVGAGAAATAIAGASILVPLAVVGLVAGVGMAGYGAYKAATAKTDGEAKQALETCGMGVTTTALGAVSAGSVLDKAAEAGVKSAQVAEDAGFLTKIKTLFEATPEALKVSGQYTKFNLGQAISYESDQYGNITKEIYNNGAYKEYDYGHRGNKNRVLTEEVTPTGVKRTYTRGNRIFLKDESVLVKEQFVNGDYREYEYINGAFKNYTVLKEEGTANGTYKKYTIEEPFFKKDYSVLSEEKLADGTINKYGHHKKHIFTKNTRTISQTVNPNSNTTNYAKNGTPVKVVKLAPSSTTTSQASRTSTYSSNDWSTPHQNFNPINECASRRLGKTVRANDYISMDDGKDLGIDSDYIRKFHKLPLGWDGEDINL